jgi:hypothetical protein
MVSSMAAPAPRVCPFCREIFDGRVARCPAHDLALVPAHRLPSSTEATDEEALVGLFELRRGRGVIFLGALLALVGFVLPLFVDAEGRLPPRSGLSVASELAPVLFLAPAAAALVASIALRRGTARALRRMRIVVPALALVVIAVEGHVLARVLATGARELQGAAAAGYGAGVVFAGAALIFAGGLLLGGTRPARR